MLTSTKPRSPTPRATRAHQPPPISYPITAPRPSSQATVIAAPVSPPITTPRGRRPSISNTMHWLSRNSTQSSSPYAPSKPTRISEPKLVRSIELLSHPRSGVLGSGATIVRTPDEALRETGVRLTFDGKAREACSPNPEGAKSRSSTASNKAQLVVPSPLESPPVSPPLPPLPMPEEEETEFLEEPEAPKSPPRPIRAPPTPPSPSLRSSLKSKPVQSTEDANQVPPPPANISTSPPLPPFRPILISEVPTGAVDPSKIIVTLETCTATYRTTLETLKSRTSHLSKYLSFLLPSERASAASSVYSTTSDDISTYRYHLTSRGLLAPASFGIHIFLDRPSAPYVHILSYLRSPVASPEALETLPKSIQMQSSSNLRLECLLELRDEAAYLNLEGLHKLCSDEIRQRHGPRLHTRGHSASTIGSTLSLHASVYSLHALLERVESDMRSNPRNSQSSGSKSTKGSATEMVTSKSPPTPQSWNGPPRGRSEGRSSPVRPPPPGWI